MAAKRLGGTRPANVDNTNATAKSRLTISSIARNSFFIVSHYSNLQKYEKKTTIKEYKKSLNNTTS